MADNTNKIDLEVNGEDAKKKNDNSGSDLEIKNVDTSGNDIKKIDGNKLEIDLKTELPKDDQAANAMAAALVLGSQKEDTSDLQDEESTDKNITPEIPEQELIPEIPSTPKDVPPLEEKPQDQKNTDNNPNENQPDQTVRPTAKPASDENTDNKQTSSTETSPEKPTENQKLEQPSKLDPSKNQSDPTDQTQSKQTTKNPPKVQESSRTEPESTPNTNPSIQNQKNPPLAGHGDLKPKQQDNRQPPSVTKQDLADIGPHGKSGMANYLVDPTKKNNSNPNNTAGQNQNIQNPRTPPSFKDNIKNKAQEGLGSPKNTPKNTSNNIKNNFQSDRLRKKQPGQLGQLKQQRRQLESELKKLENKVDGVKGSLYMQILRFWLPPIYSAIMGITFGIKNVKGQAKIKMLQTKLIALESIHKSLQTAEAGSAVTDATIKTVRLAIALGPETLFIGTILVLITSPIIILAMAAVMYSLKWGGMIQAIEKIDKEVRSIKNQLEQALGPEKKKVRTRQEIQKINQLMAADSQTRQDYLKNQNNNQNSPTNNINNLPQKPAANDNTESNNLQKAA